MAAGWTVCASDWCHRHARLRILLRALWPAVSFVFHHKLCDRTSCSSERIRAVINNRSIRLVLQQHTMAPSQTPPHLAVAASKMVLSDEQIVHSGGF